MGQYYTPVLKNENGELTALLCYDFGNGAKLMEHSYIGNKFVAAVLHEMVLYPQRLWWLGDYANADDFANKDEEHTLTDDKMKVFGKEDSYKKNTGDNAVWEYDNAYVVNLDKNCYIKLGSVGDDFTICPICLLTAVGNGRGGGDYLNGTCMEYVGTWAGDKLLLEYDLLEKHKDFEDCTDKYHFEEKW